MSVLVVGSAALDSVETPHGKVENALGGSAFFFSSAASYFTKVHLVAVVGEDFPMNELDYLKQKNVDLSGLVTEKGKTFRWGGKYHENMNDRDTLYTHLNVFENFSPQVPEKFRNVQYVFLANIQPELQLQVLKQINKPKLVVLDTMNYWIERTPEALSKILKLTNVLIINDSESKQLTGESNLLKASAKIMAMGPQILVVKKGEHGAMLITNDVLFWAPAYPLKEICDPTGAGDTFAGGFVGYLAKSDDHSPLNLRRAVIYGSALASFCVERFSVDRLKDLTMAEIDARYREFKQLTQFD
jgi:sugar/nucleoside kinase (ribokinase family)